MTAKTESFIGTLKGEMLQDGCFEDAADARLEIFDFIEGCYNTQRKHSSLNYLTPTQFETQILSTTLVQKSVAPQFSDERLRGASSWARPGQSQAGEPIR